MPSNYRFTNNGVSYDMQDLYVQKSFFTPPTIGLFVAGYNLDGELGDGTTISKSSPVQVGALTTWAQLAACEKNTFGIKSDGTLWGWGANQYWSLGIGDNLSRSSPTQIGLLTSWSQVSTGNHNTSAIKTDGTLWSWGDNYNGNLGYIVPFNTQTSSPQQVGTMTNWASVSCSYQTTAAVKADGTLFTWGNNASGQLGYSVPAINNVSSIVQVGALTTWSIVDPTTTAQFTGPGSLAIYAIKQDGSLWASGANTYGQFGLPVGNFSSPVQVGTLNVWKQVTASIRSALMIKTDGTLWACGYNRGTLGVGDLIDRSSPVQVGALTNWSMVSICVNAVLATKTDGTLWAWGDNYGGYLGLSDRTTRSSPTQVGTLTTWAKVACGYSHTIAVKTDGTLWSWGRNNYGQLGLGDITDRSSPVQVGTLTTWARPTCASQSTFIIKTDGTAWACGYNAGRILGTNNTVDTATSSVVQIGSLTTWKYISSGAQHSLALKTDGTLWGWGSGYWNNIDPTTNVNGYASPILISSLTTWSQIVACAYSSSGNQVSGAIGTRYSWGKNSVGQLGTVTTLSLGLSNTSSPVQVGALTTWTQVSSARRSTLAIQTNGTLWSWGDNYTGSLGLGLPSSAVISSPQQVGTLTTWKQVSANENLVAAIKTDGTLWTWGANAVGQTGLNNIIPSSSPVQVGALTNWKQVSTSNTSFVALKTDGTMWTCGDNSSGQLGIGSIVSRSSPVQVGALTTWTAAAAGLQVMVAIQNNG